MKIFMLDLSKCKKLQLDRYDKPIPCKIGEYNCDLDVIEDRIPTNNLAAWRKKGKELLAKTGRTPHPRAGLAFDLKDMPVGATITVVGEEEERCTQMQNQHHKI